MTKADSPLRDPISQLIWWILAAIAVFVYFFGLTIPLVGPDEPRYAQVAREMFERGDWVTPTLGGFHWFEKPALLYWLEIAAYKVFGVSEFSARFGPALFGLGTVASLRILGKHFNAETQKRGENELANWLGLIAASSIGIIVFAHGASFDIILTFPITAAMTAFFVFDRRAAGPQAPSLRVYTPLFAFYVFIGLALLAKGLVGIIFPFAIVAFYYLLSWRLPDRRFVFSLFWGTLISIAVAAVWYLPMYRQNGWEFIDEFFIQHHFQRFTSNKYFHPQPFYFFFWVLPLMTIPWLPFFLAGLWRYLRSGFNRRDAETPGEEGKELDLLASSTPPLPNSVTSLLRFALAWLLVPLIFFSFSGSKLPGYILPAVPAALVFAAVCVDRFVYDNERRAKLIQAMALGTFAVVVALMLFVVPRFADSDSVRPLTDAANAEGHRSEMVLMLHRVSHNAEFYAAGRLLRDAAGKQRILYGPAEVLDAIRKNGGEPALVMVPVEYLKQLEESPLLRTQFLKDNGELAIVFVAAP